MPSSSKAPAMGLNSPGRIIGIGVAVAVLVVAVGFGAVYGLSEWRIHRHFERPVAPLNAVASPDLVEGERMARIVGCWDGCHGPKGEGGHQEIRGLIRQVAPTLSEVLPHYSDDELVRLIRYGIKRNGESAVGMIAYTFWAIGDEDLANIIAHLRRQPTLTPKARERELTWRGRFALATGEWKVSAEQVDTARTRWGNLPQTSRQERGRYLASITCTECHGLDFRGDPIEGAPSLAIIGIYSPEQFMHLIRTAQPVGGRKLNPDMEWVQDAPFTDEEVLGLYEFLRGEHGFKP